MLNEFTITSDERFEPFVSHVIEATAPEKALSNEGEGSPFRTARFQILVDSNVLSPFFPFISDLRMVFGFHINGVARP